MPDLPYASSKAGAGREREIRQTLRDAGATAVGFMVDDDQGLLICQFRLGGRQVTVPVSMRAYEAAWRKAQPRGPRTDKSTYDARAAAHAETATWAILADWVKAQTAMILGGLMTPETAFLPHVHLPDGRRVAEAISCPSGAMRITDLRGGDSA